MNRRTWIRILMGLLTAFVVVDIIFWHEVPRFLSTLLVLSFFGAINWLCYQAARRYWAEKKPEPRRHPTIRPKLP